MSNSAAQKKPPLVDRMLQTGKLAFDPDLSEEVRKQGQHDFKELIERYRLLIMEDYSTKAL